MSDEADDSLDDLYSDLLVSAGDAQVAVWRDIKAEYEALSDKQKGRFTRIMELWCQGDKLPEHWYNGNEGRATVSNLMLHAFKGFKIRLYGFVRPVAGVKTFIMIDIDPAKKQDRADPGILKRAKGRVDDIGKRKKK